MTDELKEADLSKFPRTYNPCDECPYGIEKRDGSGNDSMCKICEFKMLLDRRAAPENKPLICPLLSDAEVKQPCIEGPCPAILNEPLTMEQLRKMDGDPMWVVDITGAGKEKPRWYQLSRNKEFVKDFNQCKRLLTLYGKAWLAYARKPEGSEI